jgi:predicted dehydrogenase
MSYGEEVLSVAKSRSTMPAASWKDEEKHIFEQNNSWRYEMQHFFDAINEDKPIEIGNSDDALKLMTLIDKCYKNGDFKN